MAPLNSEQQRRAKELLQRYLEAPSPEAGAPTPAKKSEDLDRRRVELIEKDLRPLVSGFLAGTVQLADFKSKVDGINKRNEFWGFKGIKGQMFFNLLVNVAEESAECAKELTAVLRAPSGDAEARARLAAFAAYVKRVADAWVAAGNVRQGAPRQGSIPFFVSYFWQIQDRAKWPIYYTNSVQVMAAESLWQPTGEVADDYLAFKQVHMELAALFAAETSRQFTLYDVEHVFWFAGENPYEAAKVTPPQPPPTKQPPSAPPPAAVIERLPDSFVPPVVAVLPQLARGDETLALTAAAAGTSIDRSFERTVHAAFTILGYEAKLLGQGQGRVPDGLAIAADYSYAILWDAKSRSGTYSIGTDDRAIREYISGQGRVLRKQRSLRKLYYVLVSSAFSDDFDDKVRSLKMETEIDEVILLEADALVAMVDARIRAPLEVSLGPEGIQHLFSTSGVINAADARAQLL